ncbi:MAG: SET domain-containing protein [Campylobacterales bacterium]|nr:SET domain-containing protein [Campylobacterales bacterium]
MRRLSISDEGGYRRVVALEPIPKGSLTIDMRGGETIALEEMDDSYYAFQIDEALFLGTKEADEQDLTCFLNHSCHPNLSFHEGEAILINHHDIAPGEELT